MKFVIRRTATLGTVKLPRLQRWPLLGFSDRGGGFRHRRQDSGADSGHAPERCVISEGAVLRECIERFLEAHRAGIEPESCDGAL